MDKIFADGFIFKRNDNAPDFVVGRLSIKVDEAIKFLTDHQSKGWVNIDIKKSQGGKFYTELDQWKPRGESQEVSNTNKTQATDALTPKGIMDEGGDDLPF